MSKKIKYVLCRPSTHTTSYYMKNVDKFTKVDLHKIIDSGMKFHIGVPDDEGTVDLTTDFTNTGVVTFDSMDELVFNYTGDITEDGEYIEPADEDSLDKIHDLISTDIVLEVDVKRRTFTVINMSDILEEWMNEDEEDEEEDDDTLEDDIIEFVASLKVDYPKIVREVDKFLTKLESLVEHESARFTMRNGKDTVVLVIIKKGTVLHDKLIEDGTIITKELDNGRDFSYQHGILKTLTFIYSSIIRDGRLNIWVSVVLDKLDKSSELPPISKVYAFILQKTGNDSMKCIQLDAKTLLDCDTRINGTNETIDADIRTIYCGADKNDIICGFDMV